MEGTKLKKVTVKMDGTPTVIREKVKECILASKPKLGAPKIVLSSVLYSIMRKYFLNSFCVR